MLLEKRQRNRMTFHPRPQHPCHHRFRSANGYAARRGSEAGPVPGGRERRRLFHPGFAENGSPPQAVAAADVPVRHRGLARMPSQRNRSCGQKPPNGALRGVTFLLPNAAALSAPSFACSRSTAVIRAWMKAVDGSLQLTSPLEGEMPRTGQRGVQRRPQRPMAYPPLSVSPTSPPQGGRSDRACRRALSNQGMQSHVR